MATTPQNNAISESTVVQCPILAATAINSGDLVQLSSNAAIPAVSGSATVHGVSEDTNPVASLGDTLTVIAVRRSGLFKFYALAGISLTYDAAMYVGADAQTLTNVDPGSGKICARCRELATVTAVTGTRYLFEFVPNTY